LREERVMKKNLKIFLAVIDILVLNLITFLYLLADIGSVAPFVRFLVFVLLWAIGAVIFSKLVKRWWLAGLGTLGVLLIGIRALFIMGGINSLWLRDFALFLVPVVIIEVWSFTGSKLKGSRE
jgi:hypothetical protein